jgi:DNA polymerase-1
MSAHGLMVAADMSFEQATTFIKRYKDLRRPLFDYMDKLLEVAREEGYVETMFGRRRPMPDIKSPNFMVRQGAERQAINMPIQGTEADLMKLAMVQVQNLMADKYPSCQQLLQIHDSILVECAEADAIGVSDLLQETMQNVYKLPVKLDVDVTIGDNWGEL